MKMTHHLAHACFAIISLSMTVVQSHADVPSDSLRAQAVFENSISDKEKINATSDARVEGMLSLKDPRLELTTRKFKYFAQFNAQQFKPAGSLRSDLNYNFDLNQNNTTLMPGVTVGVTIPAYSNETIKTNLSIAGKISYSNQATQVVFPSGYVESDVRLSTLLLGAKPFVTLSLQKYSWLGLNLGLEYGDLSYTQTSSNDLATFSKHADYKAWNMGLSFELSPTWSVTANYANRKLNNNNTLQIQSNNYELGTQITW